MMPEAGPVTAPARGREPDVLERRFKHFKGYIIKHGYTENCIGCRMIRENRPPQSHSE